MEPAREERPPPGEAGPGSRLLSVVVPCFDEEEVLGETHRRLVGVLEGIPGIAFELVYVDDGSRDSTVERLRRIQQADRRVRVVVLSRNFGQEMAVTAGLEHAAGDAVVLIDADLQDPPEVIPEMVDRWRGGAQVAYGQRTEREGEGLFKRWSAALFYRFLGRVADFSIPRNTGHFRLMDREVVEALRSLPERARYLRGMVSWTGFRQEAVQFRRAPRFAGETKWPLHKMVRLGLDAVLSFSSFPLRLATWFGGAALVGAAAVTGYALVFRLVTGQWVSAAAALFVAVLFLGGAQLLVVGILGEYVGRIYAEVQRRPLYLVADRLGFGPGAGAGGAPAGRREPPAADGRPGETPGRGSAA